MKKYCGILLAWTLLACSPETENASFSEENIRDYLMSNPAVVIEIINNAILYQKEKTGKEDKASLQQIHPSLLESSSGSIIHGKGDLTLIEFFDYQCGYCKKAYSAIHSAIRKDNNVRIIYKEFPILGTISTLASRAAIAAQKQGKYIKYHMALMTAAGRLNEKKIFSIAQATGLDLRRLRFDMKSKDIKRAIHKNHKLAQKLSITGTPSFVLIKKNKIEFVSGIQSEAELLSWFKKLRSQ